MESSSRAISANAEIIFDRVPVSISNTGESTRELPSLPAGIDFSRVSSGHVLEISGTLNLNAVLIPQ